MQQQGRVPDRLACAHRMEAATKIRPKVSLEYSSSDIMGLEGATIDIVEEAFLIARSEASGISRSEVSRVLDFRGAFTKKMTAQEYPTSEDADIIFARCLLLDN